MRNPFLFLLLISCLLVIACGEGNSESSSLQTDYVPNESATFQIELISAELAEEARKAAMDELVKYLDLYGQASITFNANEGYMSARPLAVLAMAHLFNRSEFDGLHSEKDLNRAATILELLADSHLAGEWGKNTWLASLPVLNMGMAAQIGWSEFSPKLRNKISLVIKSEADYVASLPPLSNVSADQNTNCSVSVLDVKCDTKSEENAAMAAFLSFAASNYEHLDLQGNWLVKSKVFAYHTLTTSTDGAYGGYKTLTMLSNGTMGNHNIFPNVHYMFASPTLASESVLFLSDSNRIPIEYKHNYPLLWNAIKDNINVHTFSYTDFRSSYPDDSPLWFPSAFAFATIVLAEDEALISALFKKKASTDFVAIPNSKKPVSVGFYDAEFFTNSNVLKRYIVTWLLFNQQFSLKK